MALRTAPLIHTSQGWAITDLSLDELDEILATSGEGADDVTAWLQAGELSSGAEVVFLSEGDDWFGVVTVRSAAVELFASEYGSAMASEIGGLFADLPVHETYGWAGTPELLARYGLGEWELQEMAEVGMDPALAVSELVEAIGATDLLDELEA